MTAGESPEKRVASAVPQESIDIIRRYLVNRVDRWGAYCRKKETSEDGREVAKIFPYTAPGRMSCSKGHKLWLGPKQLTQHLAGVGLPVGVHAISEKDTCKWVALDIDKHDEGKSIPVEAPYAAMEAVARALRERFDMECVVEDSGRGGWHVWIPLAKPSLATEAYRVVCYLGSLGAEAWEKHHPKAAIDRFPKKHTHVNGKGDLSGGWLRLPGIHHRDKHVSSVVLPDGSRLWAGEMWREFRRVAEFNNPTKWQALAKTSTEMADQPEPSKRARSGRKKASPPSKTELPSPSKTKPPSPSKTKPTYDYSNWTITQLACRPLHAGERRQREVVLIRAASREKRPVEEIADLLRTLYDIGAGKSNDLGTPGQRDALIQDIPRLIDRVLRRQPYEWATAAQIQQFHDSVTEKIRQMEADGISGWSVKSFTRWLKGFEAFLRTRADEGGSCFLMNTIVRAMRPGSARHRPYSLRNDGGARSGLYLTGSFCHECRQRIDLAERGKINLRPRPVTAYIAYLYLLASMDLSTGGSPIRIIQAAKKGRLPWILDCGRMPLAPFGRLRRELALTITGT